MSHVACQIAPYVRAVSNVSVLEVRITSDSGLGYANKWDGVSEDPEHRSDVVYE